MPPTKHLAYYELLDHLRSPGCGICRLERQTVARYITSLCDEQVNDPPLRLRLRQSLGFCRPHAAEFETRAHRLAVAIIYDDLLLRAQREVGDWCRSRRPGSWKTPCPLCQEVERVEESSLRHLAAFIDDPELRGVLESCDGFCVTHIVALGRLLPSSARALFLAREQQRLQSLRDELAEVRRKHDYRYAGEPWGDEKTSPTRAILRVTGEPFDTGD